MRIKSLKFFDNLHFAQSYSLLSLKDIRLLIAFFQALDVHAKHALNGNHIHIS